MRDETAAVAVAVAGGSGAGRLPGEMIGSQRRCAVVMSPGCRGRDVAQG
jgi:hypothetical protein